MHRTRIAKGAGLASGALLASVPAAQAATFDVDTTATDNPGAFTACTAAPSDCSLRGAIDNANADAGDADEITFAAGLTGTIGLGGDELPIDGETTVTGPGAQILAISGADSSRIFNVDPVTTGDPFTVAGVTLTGGSVAGDGGAIRNVDADLLVRDCLLTGNSTTDDAANDGGAIYDAGGFQSGYSTAVVGSTISGNTSAGSGGALYGDNSAGFIYESTISGNDSVESGGGVYSYESVQIADSTIAGNESYFGGGVNVSSSYNLVLTNSIVADNAASNSGPDVLGVVTASGFSLIENAAGATFLPGPASTAIVGADPQLGPLQDNGGGISTHRPAATSPVVDAGNSNFLEDQRGLSRPVDNPFVANVAGGDASDMGSVELSLTEGPQPPSAQPPAFSPKQKKKKCKKKRKKKGKKNRCRR